MKIIFFLLLFFNLVFSQNGWKGYPGTKGFPPNTETDTTITLQLLASVDNDADSVDVTASATNQARIDSIVYMVNQADVAVTWANADQILKYDGWVSSATLETGQTGNDPIRLGIAAIDINGDTTAIAQRRHVVSAYDETAPTLLTFTATGDTDSVSVTALTGTFVTGDSIAISSTNDTTNLIYDWAVAAEGAFGFTWNVAANYDTTIYLFAKDTIPNLSSSLSSYIEIKDNVVADTDPPNTTGSIAGLYKSIFLDSLDVTSISSDSGDVAGYKWYVKGRAADSWVLLATIDLTFVDTAITMNGVISPIDSLYNRVAAYDSSNNIDTGGIYDTIFIATDNFYIAIDRDSLDQLRWGLDDDTTSLAGVDSSIILSGIGGSGSVIDTSNANNDSTLNKRPEADRGYYFAYQQRLLGTWTNTWSEWTWWSPPVAISSFVAQESATSATDSIRLVLSGYPATFDSIRFSYNTVYWFSITDSVADTTVYQASAETGTPDTVTALIYLNGTNSGQAGWSQQNSDTVNVPAVGGGTETAYFPCETGDGENITNGTPAGSNDGGDNTWTYTGNVSTSSAQFHDGDSSMYFTGVGFATEGVIGIDANVCIDDSGTIDFWLYPVTMANNDAILRINSAVGNDHILLWWSGTDELFFRHRDNDNGAIDLTTSAINVTDEAWNHVTLSWHSTNGLSVTVDGVTETNASALYQWDGAPTSFETGDNGSDTGDMYIDEIKIYQTVESQ